MLAALAERINALGPHFRLPFLAVQAVEAQSGRKGVVAFACEQDDLAVKIAVAVMFGTKDIANLQTGVGSIG